MFDYQRGQLDNWVSLLFCSFPKRKRPPDARFQLTLLELEPLLLPTWGWMKCFPSKDGEGQKVEARAWKKRNNFEPEYHTIR